MRALSVAFTMSFVTTAALLGTAGLLVIASFFVADARPEAFLGIHLFVGGVFVALGLVLMGILFQVIAIARIACAQGTAEAVQLRARVFRLLLLLFFSGLFMCLVMLAVTFGIVSRIDEGFAVFG